MPDADEIRATARDRNASDVLRRAHDASRDDHEATPTDYLLARLIVSVEALEERLR